MACAHLLSDSADPSAPTGFGRGGSRIACDPHGFPCGHAVIDSLITGLLTIPLPSGGTVVHSCFGRPPVCSTLPFLPL